MNDKKLAGIILLIYVFYVGLYGAFQGDNLFSVPLNLWSLTIIIPIFLVDAIKVLRESIKKTTPKEVKENLKDVTVVIPSMNGEESLGEVLENLVSRFKKDNIIVASNGSTDKTISIAKAYGVRYLDEPKGVGKVEAINLAMPMVKTPYTLLLDDDTLIKDAPVPTNLLDEGYGAVAFRVLPVKENWLTTIQLYEYKKSMDIGRAYHNNSGTVQTVSGAIGLFHTNELLKQVHLHTKEFSGEDLQRTLLVHNSGSKGVVYAESTVYTYAPKTLKELFLQRSVSWYPGFLSNLKMFISFAFRRKVSTNLRIESLYSLLVVVGLDILRLLSLPILLFSPTFISIFYISYILIEIFPYMKLGAKDPVWVLLVTPFYGLFNFVTRIVAYFVFLYRRMVFYMSSFEHYDDYKKAQGISRGIGVSAISLLAVSSLTSFAYVDAIEPELRIPVILENYEPKYLLAETYESNPTANDLETVIESNDFVYQIQPGDSPWIVGYRLIDNFSAEYPVTSQDKETLTYYLTERLLGGNYEPYQSVSVSKDDYYKVYEDVIKE